MGKGSTRRPCRTGHEENDLRWSLAMGLITREMFVQKFEDLVRRHKIIRDGKVIHAQGT